METVVGERAFDLEWFSTLGEVINLRSFSNLWYWVMLAVVWSSSSHWVLGVPYDMVTRAAAQGGEAETDLSDIIRVNVNRLVYIGDVSGLWIIGFGAFFLSFLGLSGFVYGFQLAQAVFLITFPMSIVGLLSFRTARNLQLDMPAGKALRKALMRHRLITQVIGMISIFITALWGMYQNLSYMMPDHIIRPLG
ncbi:MAG: component of SufBCD complex [Paracoccaceae bacterium]|uniref:component of SufBCD complex n=1 Tax=Seohaeicola saemankumensis TaxID=481181 RepID=UPI002E7ACCBA|nr:component of SufBCD complex [Seohaeicola saemankumensis]